MTDAVRGKLSTLSALQVIARSSSGQYKTTSKTPRQIGDELGVQYLLTGTVRWEKAGGTSRVQVNPELIQVATSSTRWQQPFDAALTDVFQVQEQIAGDVAQALDVALGAGEQQALAARPTRSLPAYDAFLRGERASNAGGELDPVRIRRAMPYYEQAVALDSTFVVAWVRISQLRSVLAGWFGSVPDKQPARAAADRALALAPLGPKGHLALGVYRALVENDHRGALREYSAGLERDSNDVGLLTYS
jgi:TolB-like protein